MSRALYGAPRVYYRSANHPRECNALNHPEADLKIVSNDGIKFRVQSRELKMVRYDCTRDKSRALIWSVWDSPVFEHMGDSHSIPTGIPFDENCTTLKYFLCLALERDYFTRRGLVALLSVETAKDVIETCRKYDATGILAFLAATADQITFTATDAQETFILGCELRSEMLCDKALERMDLSTYPHMDKHFLENVSKEHLHAFHCAAWKSHSQTVHSWRARRSTEVFSFLDHLWS